MSTDTATWRTDEYPHPDWCAISRCSPHPRSGPAGGEHSSAGTLWQVQSNEADVIVRVVRGTDIDPRTGRDEAETRVEFVLMQHAWEVSSDDGADAGLSVEDARMVATILTRYADIAERDRDRLIATRTSEMAHREIR